MIRGWPSHRSNRSPARRAGWGLVGGLILALAALPAHADPIALVYERAVMMAADARCHLFTPELSAALAAAEAQARGAALRAGAGDAAVDETEQRARAKAGAVPCNSRDIAVAADRVRAAFAGYSRLQRMSYPGEVADWQAVRGTPRQVSIWRLSQTDRFGGGLATFGLAGRDGPGALIVVAAFPDGAQPYTARLILRDRGLAPEPFLNMIQADARGGLPLASRLPPRSATLAVLPEARDLAEAALLPAGARSGVAFRFPKTAADAIAALDPREAVAIEFDFPSAGRDASRTAYFEVGDFAAGRAFLPAPQR